MNDTWTKILILFVGLSFLLGIAILIDRSAPAGGNADRWQVFPGTVRGPGIGLIRIDGVIHMTEDAESMLPVSKSSDMYVKWIRRAADSDRIRAIVLRINSPGGTVAATQEIYEAVQYARRKGKQVIASMGDIAASGAYYIASACNYIFANPGSLVGSIGVLIQTPNLKGAWDRIGIRMNTIKGGRYKDILSMHRDMTSDESAMLQAMVTDTYNQFLSAVSAGRNQSIEKVRSYAEGRIFNGRQALSLGMIDAIGDLYKALDYAHQKAGLPGEKPHVIPIREDPLRSVWKMLYHLPRQWISALWLSDFPVAHGMDAWKRYEGGVVIEYRFHP